ncbi:hypothetical protein FRC11_014187, partial [Ceratobasidium sp. 423]
AFEVAAVCFRDQMERSIQRLYDILSTNVPDKVPSPAMSTGELSDIETVYEELRDSTMRLNPDASLIVPKKFKAILPPPSQSSQRSSRQTSRRSFKSPVEPQTELTTAALVEEAIRMMRSPTTNSQASSLSTTPPDPSYEPSVTLPSTESRIRRAYDPEQQ